MKKYILYSKFNKKKIRGTEVPLAQEYGDQLSKFKYRTNIAFE